MRSKHPSARERGLGLPPGQEIVDAYLQARLGERGDWRALEALVTRVHGRPVERVETVDVRINVRNMTPSNDRR